MDNKDRFEGLAGQTEIWTSHGFVQVAELAGREVEVYVSRRGHPYLARVDVQPLGEAETLSVTVVRDGIRRVYGVTDGVCWRVLPRKHMSSTTDTINVTTAQLRAGFRLRRTVPHSVMSHFLPSPFGVAAGIVFGDGTINQPRGDSKVTLYNGKRELAGYFEGSTQRPSADHGVPGIVTNGLPRYFKSLPDPTESSCYLYGWLAGYFATDGCVSKEGQAQIGSVQREHMEAAQHIAARLGIIVGEVRTLPKATNLHDRPFEMSTLGFSTAGIPLAFFLRTHHRERVNPSPRAHHCWVIEAVEPGPTEMVYNLRLPSGRVAQVVAGGFVTLDAGDDDDRLWTPGSPT